MFLIDKMYPIQCLKKLTLDCPPPGNTSAGAYVYQHLTKWDI